MAMSRRTFLAASGVAGAATGTGLLSACSSGTKTTAGANGAPTDLEVFSWWTAGGEKDALAALVAVFTQNNPHVAFVNRAVTGGAGANAQAVLAKRLAAKNPPDTFQAQAGAMVGDYITAGQVEDLTFLYQQQGWDKQFNPQVLKLIQRDSKYYSVPVDIHHINVLWSNINLCRGLGISTAPKTMTEFIGNLAKVKAHGKMPLAVSRDPGQDWQVKHIMETVLVSTLKADEWAALWKKGGNWSSAKVSSALSTFHEIMGYAPGTGSQNTSWDQVSSLVGSGDAAYQIMGDWTEANFAVTLKLTGGVDYSWAPVPGTQGTFLFAADCFTLPVGAKDREAAIAWLTTCGSQTGQDDFTSVKGAIPPRSSITTDERGLFDSYLQWSLDEWRKDTIAGSLTHGVVASGAWNTAIDTAVIGYLKDNSIQTLQNALVAAAAKYQV
ncbi:ABC transporter substrate-binding protein [Streptacidiphilus carbonis]|uniref:ABC transporter substrate-binding protein n=1 Tax=Streptacidiphilus carbonis TaxID=105422 RepID=UPI0006943EDB|nr:ABC transporter substrate-binding protein [Streptacidiphilus carbonis]